MKSPFDVSEDTELSLPERRFQDEGNGLLLAARRITVTNQSSYEEAVKFGKSISSFVDTVKVFFKPLKKAAKAAHQALCDRETELLRIPLEADSIANRTATAWKIKAQQLDAAKAAQAREAEEKRKRAAEAYISKGDMVAAEKLLEADLSAPQEKVDPEYQKVSGTRSRREWYARIEHPEMIPDQWWTPDEKRIKEHAKIAKELALPGGPHEIPGVVVYFEDKLDW